jgi:hypothetical protein
MRVRRAAVLEPRDVTACVVPLIAAHRRALPLLEYNENRGIDEKFTRCSRKVFYYSLREYMSS